jgi:hypothetical protein
MNNEKNEMNSNESVFNNDERRGLNESANYENARNNYQNTEPTLNEGNNPDTKNTNEVDDDIRPLENGHQNKPGSNGAFPVGAFDTSKD